MSVAMNQCDGVMAGQSSDHPVCPSPRATMSVVMSERNGQHNGQPGWRSVESVEKHDGQPVFTQSPPSVQCDDKPESSVMTSQSAGQRADQPEQRQARVLLSQSNDQCDDPSDEERT